MPSMQEALAKVEIKTVETPKVCFSPGEITPLNPSRKATARVKNKLPVPEVCPNCGKAVHLYNHDTWYGRTYGEWPWVYACEDRSCNSSVGLHPFTGIPLGTLANAELRSWRVRAKKAFAPLYTEHRMSRSQAYEWLAAQMSIAHTEDCHIGWFTAEQCKTVLAVCGRKMAEPVKKGR